MLLNTPVAMPGPTSLSVEPIIRHGALPLPGVYTLGAAQIALKHQGCAIGSRVLLAGTGPLLYLVAYQYAKAGAHVAAVLDSAAFADKLAAVPAMLSEPTVLAKGLYYLGWLQTRGIPVH